MNSLVEENYLKALHSLTSAGQSGTGVAEVSTRLGLKMPAVTSMMRKLADKGSVEYEPYRPLRLTPGGVREAAAIVRKHRLTERFLTEKMGFGWEEVHDIAEQIEHVRSPRFFEKMDELLGYPDIDPHGSPIPDADGNLPVVGGTALTDAGAGAEVRLLAVRDESTAFLTYLNQRGLRLGMSLRVVSVEAFDGSMTVAYEGRPSEVLSAAVCERLVVGA
jgi:DtxR family transcriptional regulator, Mn-dependent transcriptional regulator